MTTDEIISQIREGDRANVIERHGDEWRLAQTKGGACIGTSTHDTLAEAKRAAKPWGEEVKVKR